MNLVIDLGNTRLKWAVINNGNLIKGTTLNNHQLNRHNLGNIWQSITPPQRLAISCVSANELLAQVQSVALELWPDVEIILVKSQARAFGVINAYQQPEKLGVDRWLALVAARHIYSLPVCIADCGTAITVDLMDAHGKHQGGLISPGLTLMKQALAQGTEALQFNQSSYDIGPANFTEAAIYNGTLFAAVGLIESILMKQPGNTQLILTGGDAELIAQHLSVQPIVDTDLVLRGLAIVLAGEQ